MKRQLNLYYLTFLSILFDSFGRVSTAFKGKWDADIITVVALIMIVAILSIQIR